MTRVKYTQEQINFMCSLNHLVRREIANLTNEKFGTKIDRRTVNQILLRNGYQASSNGQFIKGQKSWNKGKKGYMGANKTSFKKGQKPHNTKPLFSERIDRDGYVLIKTKNGYMPKARYIYEQHHNLKLGRHEIVIFIDNDKHNFDISNLRAVTWKENGIMSSSKFHILPPKLKDIAIGVAKVEAQISTRRKHG